MTATYPELRALGEQLGSVECVLDGEIVAFDRSGRPSFERLQRRINVGSDAAVKRLAGDVPVVYEIFDLLWLEGHSAMPLGYADRRRLLDGLELAGASWQTPAGHVGDGPAMLALTRDQGLEGVVAKRLNAPYEPGRRSGSWIKIKNPARVVCEIGGFTYGEGNRSARVGALVLGVRDRDGRLVFAGKAGSGLTEAMLDRLAALLEPIRRDSSPFEAGTPPRDAVFVEPLHRVEVEYLEWTKSSTLRHPTFKNLVEES